jgi:hypothetical protein
LGIGTGGPGACCLAGCSYRVADVIVGRQEVTGGLVVVQVNDIWVSPSRDHTGLVSQIDPAPAQTPGGQPALPVVWITHASSAQHRLATNRFDVYFHGAGSFFR